MGHVQKEFGLATEQAQHTAARWQEEHQPLVTLQAQGDRFGKLMTDRWSDARDRVEDGVLHLSSLRQTIEADADILVARLQERFDLSRETAESQVSAWLDQTREWIVRQTQKSSRD